MSEIDPLKLKRQLHVDKVAEFEKLFWLSSCVCVCVCVCLGGQNGGRWQIAGVPDGTQNTNIERLYTQTNTSDI